MSEPGRVVGGCRLESILGRGADGTTWAALHLGLDSQVVVKLLDAKRIWGNPELVERFLAEGKALAKVHHVAIVRVLDAGREGDDPYLILERLPGPSLRTRLREEKPTFEEAVAWAARLAEGLQAVHSAGQVHRDIKPENILFDADGEPVLVDFGIALGAGERDQATVLGTPAYMSPEAALSRPLDGRSDLYSLGVLLFELLCNRWPFNAPTPRLLLERQVKDVLETEPLQTAGVSKPLIEFVAWALEKEPHRRPQNGTEFAQGIRKALEAGAGGGGRRSRRKKRRKAASASGYR
ncbi:MAG: serine/threonine protein kinase, partial [Planctomycetes bacterium]|nr:serine/threonine protein kinase [Planctomycetota bacterium]